VSSSQAQGKRETNPPDPVSKYETHRYAAIFKQPRLVRDAAEKLGHELFTENGLGYMRDEMQLGVYYTGVSVFRRFRDKDERTVFPRSNVDVKISVF
jgi:hypothetical protein